MLQNAMVRYSTAADNKGVRNDAGLTLGQVQRFAPSALTAEAHPDRSDKYVAISTRDMVTGLKTAGFVPVEARQTRVLLKGRNSYAQHAIRLRQQGGLLVGGIANEIILTNSHDGSSSFRMLAGYFRMVCSNGLVAGDIHADVRIQHRGDAVERAQVEAQRLIDRAREGARRIEAMRLRVLSVEEYTRLARQAAEIRWGETAPIRPQQLLAPRRYEDRGNDLWTVFNRIQENVIRGGNPGIATTGRRMTTRAVTSIDADLRINAALWRAAEEMLEA